MFDTARKFLSLLSPHERLRGYVLLLMVVVMALLDMVGVASILPFMKILADPDAAVSNRHLNFIYSWMGFQSTQTFAITIGASVFILLSVATVFKALTTYTLARFAQMLDYGIARRLVAGYLRQPYDWFLNKHSADIGKTILSEVSQVTNGIVLPSMQIIASSAVSIAIISLIVFVNPLVSITIILGLGAIYTLIYMSFRRFLARIGEERVAANVLRYKLISEIFSGIKDIKISGLEDVSRSRYDSPAYRYARHQSASQIAAQLPRHALEIVALGGMLLLSLSVMGTPGKVSTGLPLIALYGLAGFRLLPAFQQIYANLTRIRFSGPALNRLCEEMAELPADETSGNGLRVPVAPLPLRSALRFDCVTYGYPMGDAPVLDRLSLEIPVQNVVGLVGATGGGKTTAVDVMLGLLIPQSGRVLVDEVPLSDENRRRWRRAVGYVPQQVFLSDDTVAANIAFGELKDDVDMAAVERAARIANLHEFVVESLPQGYQTRIGERGVRLSGGQRQRIGIARALYRDPEVLFLDEATSALDNVTEHAVMDAIHNLGRKKTIVLIAHRLTTVRDCDVIFVLDHGQLVGQGTYEELLATNMHFRAMVRADEK